MLEFLFVALVLAAPLALAAMGGFTSERAGVINIGLEGMMLGSACATALVGVRGGAVAGLLAGLAVATALSLLHWLATQKFQVDHVISGMALNALAAGGANTLFQRLADPARTGGVPHLPVAVFTALALLLPLGLALGVRRTRAGLRLLAVGSDPDKARLMGVRPRSVRFGGLVLTGLLTGLAGAQLVAYTENFTDTMVAGRGYIALAALILGGWRPVPTALACLAFGTLLALRIQFAATPILGATLPGEFWAALPYLVTVIALAGLLGRDRTPAGLGRP